jgi:hypothetical protein
MGENLRHKKIQYYYCEQMCTGRAKPLRIIGSPDNQQPDKWSSTAIITFDVQFTLVKHLLKPKGQNSYCCTAHFDNVQNSFYQQMHP